MARLNVSKGMTNAHSDRMQNLLSETHQEMAHWSGTGPENTFCFQCEHYHYVDAHKTVQRAKFYKRGPREGQLNEDAQRSCAKFRSITDAVRSRRFPPKTRSCLHFEGLGK